MIQLPPPLAPWASLLEIFPTDLARSLGPLVQRLDVAIGPLRSAFQWGQGEPDGYDGLARRGLYERLIVSDWLLADELPEEFFRRAATGEHSFLKLAHRERAQARSCVALFDAGPTQLGAPRLAQLASLIVLARRAQLANARFEWGILQDESHQLFDEISPLNIETWLKARTVQTLANTQIESWREVLDAREKSDDFWLIGGRELEECGAARGTSLLLIEDPLEIETRTLQVQFKMSQRSPQKITLELPADADCARLLREPFSNMSMAAREWRKVSVSCAARSNLLFADATRLLARSDDGVVLYQIPKSPKGGIPRPKRYQCDVQNLVAAGLHGKAIMVVVKSGQGFYLLCLNKQNSPFEVGPYAWTGLSLRNSSPDFSAQLAPLFFLHDREPLMWLPLAKDQSLLQFKKDKKAEALSFLVSRANQISVFDLLYAISDEKGQRIMHLKAPDDFKLMQDLTKAETVFFFNDAVKGKIIGAHIEQNVWAIFHSGRETKLSPPKEIPVVGVMHHSSKWQQPGLVCLSTDKRSLAIWGRIEKRVEWNHILRAAEEIKHVTVCPTAPRIAYATEYEVAVYCLETQNYLLRVRWEEV